MDALEALRNDDLLDRAYVISTADALRAFLRHCPEVISLKEAIFSGEITEHRIGKFVSDLLKSFEADKKFPYEITLAAIAVTLETHPGEFADRYLNDLADLQIREVPLAWRVARLCLSRRKQTVSENTCSILRFPSPPDQNIAPREATPVPTDTKHIEERLVV